MLVFDRRSLRCVVPPTEDCEVPTTQTPVEGEQPLNAAGNEGGQLLQVKLILILF